jgi:hypothetical protein
MTSEFLHRFTLLETESAGKTGRRLAPMVRVQQKSTRQNHSFSLIRPAFPAQWCYGLYVFSPVRPGFVVTVIGTRQSIIAESAPASGRQDHTISPSASRHPRPSHPASNVRDDREAPLVGAGRADARSDLPDNARENVVTDWHDGQFAHGAYAHADLSTVIASACEAIQLSPRQQSGIASSRCSSQ